jgi:cytoskeletal protein RodZ
VTSSLRRTLILAVAALGIPALAGIIALVVVSRPAPTSVVVTQPATTSQTTPASTPTTSASASASASASTTVAPGSSVVLGTGDRVINQWSLPRSWQLVYAYTCMPSPGSFHLDLRSASGGVHVTNDEQSSHGTGKDSGSTAEATTYTLTVKTACEWMLTVSPAG